MTLAEFGVDPDEPHAEATVCEFETQGGPWTLTEPHVDESVTPAKTRCPGCGTTLGPIDPVLLDSGRDDGLVLACRLCEDCRQLVLAHTASTPDRREWCALAYPTVRFGCSSPHGFVTVRIGGGVWCR